MKCDKCKLSENCKNICQMGNGKKTARIMVVSESPYQTENMRGQYMAGRAGRLLQMVMSEVGIDIDDLYFTAVVKCSTPEDRLPKPDEAKACEDYLFAEIEVIKPDIIIPTGNVSLKTLMNVTGITKHRGKLVTKDGMKFFPMLHPNTVLKQPKWTDIFAKDAENLGVILNGGKYDDKSIDEDRRYCETFEEALDEIKRLINLPSHSRLVIDLETNDLNPWKPESKIISINFSDKPGYGSIIPLYHRETPFPGNQIGTIIKYVRYLLQRTDLELVFHNGKFDTKYLDVSVGVKTPNFKWDTMLMHYLGITEEKGTHGLKDLAWQYTNKGGYDDELDNYKKQLPEKDRSNYDLIPWEILKTYGSMDSDVTFRVFEKVLPAIKENEDLDWIYNNLMIPGSNTLRDIEANGMYVDKGWLDFLSPKYIEERSRIEDRLHQFPEVLSVEREYEDRWEERCAIGLIKKANRTKEQQNKFEKYKKYDPSKDGAKFKFSSTQQLQDLLFTRLGLIGDMLTDKGAEYKSENGIRKMSDLPAFCFSTSDDALVQLAKQHPIAKILQEFRKANHLYNNFIIGMYENLTPDGLVHPTYNLHGTVTGRLSSDSPNAQQFPRKCNDPLLFQYWHEIKKLFVSRFGDEGVILQFDYSQLELRILAVISGDPELIKLYKAGADLHKDVASKAFNVPIEEVTKDQRTASKKIGFGVVYQESPKGLSEDLKAEGIELSEKDCEQFIRKWFNRFPLVEKWVKNTKRSVKINKYVKNMLGRIRHLATIDSIEPSIRNEAERQAVNCPIQSTGSDCTLMSLILINKWLKETGKRSVIMCTVHDSIVFDCPKDEAIEVAYKVKDIMENLAKYNDRYSFLGDVPLVSELEIGYSYGELYEIDPDKLEEIGIDTFIAQQREKKHAKEEEAYKKAENTDSKIPSFVYGYWNKVANL